MKREQSVFTQQPRHPLIQPPALFTSNSNTPGVQVSNSVASQHAPAAVLSTQPNLAGGVGFGNWANVPRMPDARQGTALNLGSRSFSASSPWATPTISASQGLQSTNSFAPSRLSQDHQQDKFQPRQSVGYQSGHSSMFQESAFHGLPRDDHGALRQEGHAYYLNGSIESSQDLRRRDRFGPDSVPDHATKSVESDLRKSGSNGMDTMMHEAPRSKLAVFDLIVTGLTYT